jgi:lipopolysaccharide export system protein LptA
MKESPPQSAGTSTPTATDIKPAAPTLTEESILNEPETAALPDNQPSIALTEEPVVAPKDEKPPRLKSSSKNKKDSGFFSLSKAISINSDTMEYDNRANKGVFKGNVVARQADIVMFANSMHVYYSDGGGLSRVDAQGNVRVVQGDRIATGSRIIFNNATQTIVATGSPRVWQGDNVVHGTKITVYLKEERTVVESDSNSRASATIYPDSDKKQP